MEGEPRSFPGCGSLELLNTSLDREEVERKCQLLSSSPTSPQDFIPPTCLCQSRGKEERERDLAQGASSSYLMLGQACYPSHLRSHH